MLMLRLLAEISDGSVDDDGRVVGGRHQALPMAEVVDDGVARSALRELSADPLSCLQGVGSGRILRSLLRLKSEQVYGVEFA